jgi:hypothetical protein
MEAAERAGSDQARGMAHLSLSVANALGGQWASAVANAESAIRIWHKGFSGDFGPQMLAALTRALRGAGDARRAADVSAEAIALARRQSEPVYRCEATIAHVRCLRELDGVAARPTIETFLAEALQLIEQTGAERWRPHVHAERAELHRLLGAREAARREFTEAHRLFAAMGATGHAARLAKEIG